ncbi:unnamed protein product, partial [Lymnaea stagnalis]
CERGWYGSLCQYKCHCSNNSCTKCDMGWFGPACQYGKLYGPDDLITDADDATCVTNITSLEVVWNVSYPFTWLRLTTRHEGE